MNEELRLKAKLREDLDRASERFMYIMDKRGHIVERRVVETEGVLVGVMFTVVEEKKRH